MANVGALRQQSALCRADTPLVLVSTSPAIARLLATLKVVRVYPDTTDANGNWAATFKIEVEER